MRLIMSVILLSVAALGFQAPTSPLAVIHTVYVKGNTEASVAIRKELVRQAVVFPKHKRAICLSLAPNPKSADATLQIAETAKLGGIIAGPGVTDSGMLVDPQGDLLWSDAKSAGNGLVHSGADGAAIFLLLALEKKVCPKWHHV